MLNPYVHGMEPPIRHTRVQKERGFIHSLSLFILYRGESGGSAQARQLMERKKKERCFAQGRRRRRRGGAAKRRYVLFRLLPSSPLLLRGSLTLRGEGVVIALRKRPSLETLLHVPSPFSPALPKRTSS